ncbi:hypothetical protein ACIGW8_06580 [Streptomyces sioyaensis]|uniref:hypothetical protein n=1 Tax=Streptomyces sioyaensis TaxID=67364 RepID=UPI0037D81936
MSGDSRNAGRCACPPAPSEIQPLEGLSTSYQAEAPDAAAQPLNITPAQATALAVGLHALGGTPFAADARDALRKVLAVMPEPERAAADEFAARVQLLVS